MKSCTKLTQQYCDRYQTFWINGFGNVKLKSGSDRPRLTDVGM
ncbi:hypothetical protein VB735_11015 [Halotia wernerae UHCC 0503]|nr:hypothetical protein [Halotia wernerae UHCC 0503]